jgi:beta-N-acetylhexosaminidase
LRRVELPPFKAATRAGARLVMTAHVALPAVSDGLDVPATLSESILGQLLRIELGFDGVIISDALDMGAMGRGTERVLDAVAALAAGIDLLLLGPGVSGQEAVSQGVAWALRRGLLPAARVLASAERVLALKGWLAEQPAAPASAVSMVGCAEHTALAREIAARAITLVRDDARRLPLRLAPSARLAVLQPELRDLTPADTSSYVRCRLADALAAFRPVEDLPAYASDPTPAEVGQLVARAAEFDLVVVATVNAFAQSGQAALVNALLERHVPTVVVALRMPYDLALFPTAPTFLCAYSVLQPSLAAAAAVLFGERPATGRLPVSIPGLYAAAA